jgi:hypothetical protein
MVTENQTIKPSYQTMQEICIRMQCGPRRLKKLIREEAFPAKRIGGQYMTTDAAILQWIEKHVNC